MTNLSDKGPNALLDILLAMKGRIEDGPAKRLRAARVGGHKAKHRLAANAMRDIEELVHSLDKTIEVTRMAILRLQTVSKEFKSYRNKTGLRIALLEEKCGISEAPPPLGLNEGFGEKVKEGEVVFGIDEV